MTVYPALNCIEVRAIKNGWSATETSRRLTAHGRTICEAVGNAERVVVIFDRCLARYYSERVCA